METAQPPPLPRRMSPGSRALAYYLASAIAVTGCIGLGILFHGRYDGALFLFVPFTMGLAVTLLFCSKRRRTIGACMCLIFVILSFIAGVFFLLGAEGALCILMALPLIAIPAAAGVLIGYVMQNIKHGHQMHCVALAVFAIPVVSQMEAQAPLPELRVIRRETIIDAPREAVWQTINREVIFGKSENLLLGNGFTYPLCMRVAQQGEQRLLVCEYNNGSSANPISIHEPPARLRFLVPDVPVPMKELSIYDTHPQHLHGYLEVHYGEFRLEAVPENRTRLIAETSYRYRIKPQVYWSLWADRVFDQMHEHVVSAIRQQTEQRPE